MIAKCKKKTVSIFPVIFFVLIIDVRVYAKDNENGTVLKISDENSTHHIQPMMLIDHVPEKKGKHSNRDILSNF